MTNPQDYQIIIEEGKLSGGYFMVFPVRNNPNENEVFATNDEDIFCLDVTFSFPYVVFFFKKYFDASIQFRRYQGIDDSQDFDFFGENIFSYQSIKQVLNEIKKITFLLKTDYHNQKLNDLKAYLTEYYYIENPNDKGYISVKRSDTDEEKRIFVEENIHYLIDFYQRFIARMELMLQRSPDYQYICFSGP